MLIGFNKLLASDPGMHKLAPVGSMRPLSSVASFNDGSNQEIAFRIGLNGQTVPSTESKANTGAGGRAESVTAQGVVFLSSGSYIEVFLANNTSGGGSATVTELNTLITRISS